MKTAAASLRPPLRICKNWEPSVLDLKFASRWVKRLRELQLQKSTLET
jgi:hypothetical protein